MRPYCYIKTNPKPASKLKTVSKLPKKQIFKFLSLFSFLMGSFSLGLVVWPIVAYEVKQMLVVSNQKIVAPVPEPSVVTVFGEAGSTE